jgi:hypothetical protein
MPPNDGTEIIQEVDDYFQELDARQPTGYPRGGDDSAGPIAGRAKARSPLTEPLSSPIDYGEYDAYDTLPEASK